MAVRILEEQLINKIAAGEVVERPASVVKELVENSLDAGAKSLQVHLRAGGRNLIRIVDDGVGMNRTDALMCLERHATSKILKEEDLFSVGTLGFRGEAIPSIASISKFELLTRPHDAEMGTKVRVEGGKLLDVSPAGAAPGTEISVASIFFNVPARRKFLRSVETELGHCMEAVTREALIRPDLDLEITHDDRTLLRCAPGKSRAHRAADLLGAHGEALVPVSFSRGTLEVEALLSPVGVHRASPQGSSWLYVNGRYVRDLVVRRAVTQAYAGIVPKDRYPLVILEVRVPPEDVDVNVHPAKTEVRFVNAYALQNAVAEGLRNALQEHGIRRPVATEARYRPSEPAPRNVQVGLLTPASEPTRAPPSSSWGGGTAPATPPAALDPTRSPNARGPGAAPPSASPVASGPSLLPAGRSSGPLPSPTMPTAAPPFPPSAPWTPRPTLATAPHAVVAEPRAFAPGAEPRGVETRGDETRGDAPSGEQSEPPGRQERQERQGEGSDAGVGPAPQAEPAPPPSSAPLGGLGASAVPASPLGGLGALAVPSSSSPTDAAPAPAPEPPVPEPAPERAGPLPPDALLPVPRFRDLRVIGQLDTTYVLCEGAGELVVVDQHAAHERVTLYRLTQNPRAALGGAQRLLVPVMIQLPPARARLLAANVDRLAPYGLDVSPMGGGAFAVQALPAALRGVDLATLLADVADEVAEGGGPTAAEERLQLALATKACHTSVRAGQHLSDLEMRALLVSLDEVDFSVCAHGRPVAIRIGSGELERRFHRA